MLEKVNGELPEENEAAVQPAEETAEETVTEAEAPVTEQAEEVAAEEAAEEVAAEETTEEAAEETAEEPEAPKRSMKEKLTRFWKKVNPVQEVEVEETEQEQETAQEEIPEELAEAAQEEPVPEEPVRRKPADAFIIDFPVEEESAKEEPEAEEKAEEQEEDLFAEEEPQPEVPAKKQLKAIHWSMIAAAAVVLVGLLVVFVLKGAGVDLKPRENDLYAKDSYTASAEELEKKADTVVATIGDRKLTMAELQLYYVNAIYTFYSENYYYMSYIGLDLSKPLDQQTYMGDESMTWEQFFLDAALMSWQSYALVDLVAEQEGFQVSQEIQEQIDTMGEQLESIASAYGYTSAQEYLNTEMAAGVTPEMYVEFNRVYYVGNEYINNFYATNYPNEVDIIRYYGENEEVFLTNGITQDMGLLSSVRHILIQPQGGVTDESGNTTYSEEEWATALSEAERILEQWKVGEATEDSFATLANTYSMDGGSNTTGGLYEDIHIDASYVAEFKDWATDMTRKPGDTEIVKTQFGYHIMYFVHGEDYFQKMVGEQLVAERIQNKLTEVREAYPMDVDYKKILLGEAAIG